MNFNGRFHFHIYLLKKDEISAETRVLLEEILAPDYEVYNHFVTKFKQKLDTFTATRMKEELAELDRWSYGIFPIIHSFISFYTQIYLNHEL